MKCEQYLPTSSLFSETYPLGSTERLSEDCEKDISDYKEGMADIQSKSDIRGSWVSNNPIKYRKQVFEAFLLGGGVKLLL